MSTLTPATTIARFDYRLRIAVSLLRAAPRAEHLLVGAMALASAAAAWPFAGDLYPAVAVPALLALAALIRHHLDGLGARREALIAAGAEPADSLVIQVAGPVGATWAGAVVGLLACAALVRPPFHVLVPVAVGLVAAILVRRAWIGAPALVAGSVVALAAAVMVRVSASAPVSASALTPPAEPRSRPIPGMHLHQHAASVSSAAWPIVLAAVLTVAAAQLAVARRQQIRAGARALTSAAARRLIARSSA